jgi:imidazole glycerol-phosphate synthase subunit HisH
MVNIGLIDYGRGNLRSVEKALQYQGARVIRVESAQQMMEQDAVVLPGVGSFGDAMMNLQSRGLVQGLRDWLSEDKPFLGICLGYQLLFESSEECPGVPGLGWLLGQVVQFPVSVGKIPHMGWNTVEPTDRCREGILAGLDADSHFYHVHSYYPESVKADQVACYTEYGSLRFASGISHGNRHAFQFHPEKSQENGLKLMGNFLREAASVLV